MEKYCTLKELARMSILIEETILHEAGKFYDNELASGDELFEIINTSQFS